MSVNRIVLAEHVPCYQVARKRTAHSAYFFVRLGAISFACRMRKFRNAPTLPTGDRGLRIEPVEGVSSPGIMPVDTGRPRLLRDAGKWGRIEITQRQHDGSRFQRSAVVAGQYRSVSREFRSTTLARRYPIPETEASSD